MKQEAVKLELRLLELEEKRENLLVEENDNDPNNLQQKYLNQVKGDNVEIATMERSMNQLNDELKNYEKQLEQVELVGLRRILFNNSLLPCNLKGRVERERTKIVFFSFKCHRNILLVAYKYILNVH